MNIKFIGTGNSAGIPVFGCDCSACNLARDDEKFVRHSGCSLQVNYGDELLLIDAGMVDFKQRYENEKKLKNILITHFHADHVLGLLEARWGKNRNINVIAVDDSEGFTDLYKHPGIFNFSKKAIPFQTFTIGHEALKITPLPLHHSKPTVGYFISNDAGKNLTYLCDCGPIIPVETVNFLHEQENLDCLIIDSNFPPTEIDCRNHNNLITALENIDILSPQIAFLTHISHDLDAWLSENKNFILPENVRIASDELVFNIK